MVGAVDARAPDPRAQPRDGAAGRAQHALPGRVPQPAEQGTIPPGPDRGDSDGDGHRGGRPRGSRGHPGDRVEIDGQPAAAVRSGRASARRQLAYHGPHLRASRSQHAEMDQGCRPGARSRVQHHRRRQDARRVRRAAGGPAPGLAGGGSREKQRQGGHRGAQRTRSHAGDLRGRPGE